MKGRYILRGFRELNSSGVNVVKEFVTENPDLYSLPVQQHELRAMLTAAAREGRADTVFTVVDEESAYIKEYLEGNPKFLDLRKETAREVVPIEYLGDVMNLLSQGLTPCVKVDKGCYGLKRAIFDYEKGRDKRLLSVGAERVCAQLRAR